MSDTENSQQTTEQPDDKQTPEPITLGGRLDVIGLDATDYDSAEATGREHFTRVKVDYLKGALTIMETLGWDDVDIYGIECNEEPNPMIHFRASGDSPFTSRSQAGLTICPKATVPNSDEGDDE